MLQQILADMYIDPDLLAELSEEQKQILFFKMRQEQIRRWKEKEPLLEKEDALRTKSKKANGKAVNWLLGSDSDVWVWVMGEHSKDKPYDQICDEIITERARQQAQKEAEEIRKKNEEELVKRFSNAHLLETQIEVFDTWKKKEEEEKKAAFEEQARQAAAADQQRIEQELKKREEEERRKHEEELKRLEEERTMEIYTTLKEVQENVQKQEKEDPEWQETLRKSKAADERRKSIAKQARDDYKRHSLKAIERGRVAALSKEYAGGQTAKPSLPLKPAQKNTVSQGLGRKGGIRRTASTSTKESIIKWFKEDQIPRRAGFEKNSDKVAVWFHGIITRQKSEDLLSTKGPGHFLIRVSEKIMGYVLSYHCQKSYKHFLIDASETYSFLGVDQLQHASLVDLVDYHKVEVISMAGKEQLVEPCGQTAGGVDYYELFN
ncbi:SH24A protein, partial [Polypterus senegalus]|nr:SH2 domain-containing protein 4A [Polypterus senegalus]MBN3291991.1 SH24A protein [Polypterus senegalus]